MKERVFRYNHCIKKRAYKTEHTALKQLKRFSKRGYIISGLANAYKCKYCGKWHLGHKHKED